jgi:hypothetical protein
MGHDQPTRAGPTRIADSLLKGIRRALHEFDLNLIRTGLRA